MTTYEKDVDTYYTGKKDFALFYTMNVPDALCERMYSQVFTGKERLVARFNGECLTYCATDTKQFDDYSKYLASRYDPEAKAERNRTQFPVDLENARRIGRRLASK